MSLFKRFKFEVTLMSSIDAIAMANELSDSFDLLKELMSKQGAEL